MRNLASDNGQDASVLQTHRTRIRVLLSGAELRTGAWMSRGTIISLKPIPLLPSFLYASTYTPSFMGVYAKHLATLGISVPYDTRAGAYQRYTGDTSVIGRGEILVWSPRN